MGSAQNIDMSGGGSAFGYDGDVYTVGVAGQAMLTPVWRLGGIIGYETSDFNGHHGYGSAEGGTVFAGLSATRKFGRLSLSAAGVVSHGNFDTTRIPGLTAGGSLASADHDVTSVAGRFRAAYRYDLGAGYVTPMVDLDMIWTNAEGYTESGAGKLSLTVDDSDEFAFVATPAVEAGRNFALGDTLQLRLYGRAGISFSTLDSYQVSARFAAADPAIGSFDSDVAIPDVVGRISAGAELIGMDNVSLDLRYDGAFGSGLTSHAGNLRLNYRF
jgi:outer membrane autotransporter protein